MNEILIFSFLYLFLFIGSYFFLNSKEKNIFIEKKIQLIFYVALIVGFILRIMLAIYFKGHKIDIVNFSSWAIHAVNRGLPYFYVGMPFADYPPGYIYILYLIGLIQKIFLIPKDSSIFLLILKMPSIITDMLTVILIYKLSIQNLKNTDTLILVSSFLFNPAIILNSSVWGQVDSFFSIFIVLMLLYLIKENSTISSIFFSIALLIKPQALIFAPVLIFTLIKSNDLKKILASMVSGGLIFIFGILPFSIVQGPLFIFNKYFTTLSSYPYATLNAANVYALLGKNWVTDLEKFLFIPIRIWGIISILIIMGWTAYLCLKNKIKENILLIALVLIMTIFVFSTRMHERYLYPALPISIITFISIQDKRFFLLYGTLSTTIFLNTGVVFILSLENIYYIPRFDILFLSIALLNVFFSGWLIKMTRRNI